MEKVKVSVVLPCYNGADTIRRAIRGILNQTYRPIELILVNDGSTDNSHQVIKDMEPEIEEAGIEFIYHHQQNGGLGSAINSGLKYVTGEYLAWVDADDELLPASFRVRVEFLELHREFGSVSCDAFFAEDQDWNAPLGCLVHNPEENSLSDQFIPMLLGKSVFCAGCHLIRTEVFKKANGGMEIYPARHGQNWQMLLPVYYASKHAFIDTPLYKYRVNADNMTSEIDKMSLKQLYARRREYQLIVFNTLRRIQGIHRGELIYYMNIFNKHINEMNLDSAIEMGSGFEVFRWKCAVKLSILIESWQRCCRNG